MRTTTLDRARVLHLKAGDVQPGDEVVYLLYTTSGATHHVSTRAEEVSFSKQRTWITLAGQERPRHLPVSHPVVVVRGLSRVGEGLRELGLDLDLDLPVRVQEARHEHHGRRGPSGMEDLGVGASDSLGVGTIDEIHPRPDSVVWGRAEFG